LFGVEQSLNILLHEP
jgi:hypothetical protein